MKVQVSIGLLSGGEAEFCLTLYSRIFPLKSSLLHLELFLASNMRSEHFRIIHLFISISVVLSYFLNSMYEIVPQNHDQTTYSASASTSKAGGGS